MSNGIYLFIASLSFALSVSLMPFWVHWMKHKQYGQAIRAEGPKWHEQKSGTPAMGGVIILATVLLFSILLPLFDLPTDPIFYSLVFSLMAFGLIGFTDDFLKIFKKENEGLKSLQKFIAQLVIGLIVMVWLVSHDHTLVIPFFATPIHIALLVVLFGIIWMTGFSNAVNLTDGIDGLSGSTTILSLLFYLIYALHVENYGVVLFISILIGGILGFLCYNFKPAKIFMGDVGSLAIGGALAAISLALNQPWSLLGIGLIYVIETSSVILQVAYFKRTGKRLFKMSPIHHHFEMSGWSENKIVIVFSVITVIASAVTLLWIW